jgi:hypothetical protein
MFTNVPYAHKIPHKHEIKANHNFKEGKPNVVVINRCTNNDRALYHTTFCRIQPKGLTNVHHHWMRRGGGQIWRCQRTHGLAMVLMFSPWSLFFYFTYVPYGLDNQPKPSTYSSCLLGIMNNLMSIIWKLWMRSGLHG